MREQTATKDHRSVGRRTSRLLRKPLNDSRSHPVEFDGIRKRDSAILSCLHETNPQRPSQLHTARWGHSMTFDLSVKNPNSGEEVTHRSPEAIMDEIAALDAESAEVLQTIRGLL